MEANEDSCELWQSLVLNFPTVEEGSSLLVTRAGGQWVISSFTREMQVIQNFMSVMAKNEQLKAGLAEPNRNEGQDSGNQNQVSSTTGSLNINEAEAIDYEVRETPRSLLKRKS